MNMDNLCQLLCLRLFLVRDIDADTHGKRCGLASRLDERGVQRLSHRNRFDTRISFQIVEEALFLMSFSYLSNFTLFMLF